MVHPNKECNNYYSKSLMTILFFPCNLQIKSKTPSVITTTKTSSGAKCRVHYNSNGLKKVVRLYSSILFPLFGFDFWNFEIFKMWFILWSNKKPFSHFLAWQHLHLVFRTNKKSLGFHAHPPNLFWTKCKFLVQKFYKLRDV